MVKVIKSFKELKEHILSSDNEHLKMHLRAYALNIYNDTARLEHLYAIARYLAVDGVHLEEELTIKLIKGEVDYEELRELVEW